MTSQGVIFDLADTADRRFDSAIELMLAGLLAFMPLAFGGVHPWSELLFIAGAGAISLVLAAKLLARPDVRFVRTWAYVPMLAFLALVLLQLVPLPAGVVKLIAPSTYALRHDLLQSVPGADSNQHLRFMPLSFYPEATVGNLRLLLAVGAIFVVTINIVRRLEQVKRMLAAVAIIGTGVALVALAQNMTDARAIYWVFPIESNEATSGPFQHHSHFTQFISLAMGAALGLMLMHLDQLPRRRLHEGASLATRALTRPVTRPIWMLACAVVAMAVCVPLSLSRGGMLAMLVAGIVTAIVVGTRRGMHGRTWIFVGLVLASLAVMLLFSFADVLHRAASIHDAGSLGGRIELLGGSIDIWRKFPLFGTGLGTFAVVFSMFDPSTIVKTAEHAENEYAQLLVETGAVGGALMLVFLMVAAMAYVRCVRGAPSPMASGAMGLGFGIVAILVHSAADFGQHLPANGALTALTFAVLINLAQATRRRDAMPDKLLARAPRWPRIVAAGVVLGVAGITASDAVQVLRADVHRRAASDVAQALSQDGWRGSDRDFARLIIPADKASKIRPRDVVLRYELNWYRWKALARRLDDREQRSPRDELDGRNARRVIDELLVCTRIAPTYAPPYLLAGQLLRSLFEGDDRHGAGADLIRTAHRLEPNNPQTLIAVAILDAQAQRAEAAAAKLRRAMELSADHRQEAIDVALDELNRPELALKLAGEERALLLRVAQRLEQRNSAGEADVAAVARAQADDILLQRAARPDAPAATLAEAAELALGREDYATAIELLRRATTIDFAAHDVRLALARALGAAGETDQAIAELRTILRQSPSHAAAKVLLQQLNPAATRPADASTPHYTAPTAPATAPAFKLD